MQLGDGNYTNVKQIVKMTRLMNTVNGNPMFHMRFDDKTEAQTLPDADWCHGAENAEYHGGPVMLYYNLGGLVYHAETVAETARLRGGKQT